MTKEERMARAIDKLCDYIHSSGFNGCPCNYDATALYDDKWNQCMKCKYYIIEDSEIERSNDYARQSKLCWKEFAMHD